MSQTPYPITFTYPSSETADKQAAALKQGWEKAGFKVTLDGLGDTYYDEINKKSNKADVVWAGWGSDWPSAITVTPPLFDGRPNGVTDPKVPTNGSDYGNYNSDAFNKLVDQAQSATSLDDQTKALQEADKHSRPGRRLHPAGDHEVQLRPRVEGDRLREHARICDVPGPRSDRRLEVTEFKQHST